MGQHEHVGLDGAQWFVTGGVHPHQQENERLASSVRISPGDRVLDFGCGFGLFGVYALQKGAKHVTFVDIMEDAVKDAELNVRQRGLVKEGITVDYVQSDFFKNFAPPQREEDKYDLLIANLPQTPFHSCFRVDKWGGEHGGDLFLKLCSEVKPYMKEGGRAMIMLIGLANPNKVIPAYEQLFGPSTVLGEDERNISPSKMNPLHPELMAYLLKMKEEGVSLFDVDAEATAKASSEEVYKFWVRLLHFG